MGLLILAVKQQPEISVATTGFQAPFVWTNGTLFLSSIK